MNRGGMVCACVCVCVCVYEARTPEDNKKAVQTIDSYMQVKDLRHTLESYKHAFVEVQLGQEYTTQTNTLPTNYCPNKHDYVPGCYFCPSYNFLKNYGFKRNLLRKC
eukprot:4679036-Amphidinium_carterae.2